MITLSTNLKAGAATTQFADFAYNSMVKVGGKFFCAGDNGLFEHTGDLDDTKKIESYFEPVTMDFGISSEKRMRCIYLGYESSADFTLTVTTELGQTDTITIPASAPGQQARKIPMSRSVRGRYWTFQIHSTGVDFSIDHISVLPIVRGHGLDTN